MVPVKQLGKISWSVVCAACCHMALVFAVMHLYNIFSNLVLIIQWNGPGYQHVLALCAFLTWAIQKGLILQKFCFDVCVCFVIM